MDNRLQEHTQRIYHLQDKIIIEKKVLATELLTPMRFDLFAKLFYIKYRHKNFKLAKKIYTTHIKSFNPDLKEPGREDKKSIEDFIYSFDKLIFSFKSEEFNPKISLIPIDNNNVILDGSHRTSTMAFYNKFVSVAICKDTIAKCDFDYIYFRKRGLPWKISDIVAYEMMQWLKKIKCLIYFNISKTELIRIKKDKNLIYEKEIFTNHKSVLQFFYLLKWENIRIPPKISKISFLFFIDDNYKVIDNYCLNISPNNYFFKLILFNKNVRKWNSKYIINLIIHYLNELLIKLNIYIAAFISFIYQYTVKYG